MIQFCPCVFIRKSGLDFVIISVYVDDLNIIGSPEEISKTVVVKDFGKTKFYLCLQIGHLKNRVFVHQSTYIEKILKIFFTWINRIY